MTMKPMFLLQCSADWDKLTGKDSEYIGDRQPYCTYSQQEAPTEYPCYATGKYNQYYNTYLFTFERIKK